MHLQSEICNFYAVMIKAILLAGFGGFFGASGRFLVGRLCSLFWTGAFPLSTFLVNVAGCLLIGVFSGLFERARLLGPDEHMLLVTGLCGGFTTFSTFANDLWRLGDKAQWGTAMLYLVASIAVGVLMVGVGRWLVR